MMKKKLRRRTRKRKRKHNKSKKRAKGGSWSLKKTMKKFKKENCSPKGTGSRLFAKWDKKKLDCLPSGTKP